MAIAAARGQGGTPLALSHGFYNTARVFHSGSLPRKHRAERRAARTNVFAFYGGARSNGIHARRKSELGRTSCLVWKDLRTVEACKRRRSGKSFPVIFARPEVKAKLAEAIGRRQRTGAPHVSHGEHGRRAAHVSVFQKFVQQTQQRQHGRKHASSQRDRADPGDPYAVHLRFS